MSRDFLFSVHTITEAKQSNKQGGSQGGDLPARSFDMVCPGVAPPLTASAAHRGSTEPAEHLLHTRHLQIWPPLISL